ncbi:hypothetical protein SAMN02745866_01215 [Alteromonadaceae bacterium Bs31]|nr:hypothetical protein SAMN02745866_01215 [Alteromonadaceae bacterium Bs31]
MQEIAHSQTLMALLDNNEFEMVRKEVSSYLIASLALTKPGDSYSKMYLKACSVHQKIFEYRANRPEIYTYTSESEAIAEMALLYWSKQNCRNQSGA